MIVRLSQYRLEAVWAWLSLVTLVLCWDASLRLDERISPPRVRIAHAAEREEFSSSSRERGAVRWNDERVRTR